jgi:Lar family restriction alleviation protein
MPEDKKLKPCPHCGGQVKLEKALRVGYENCQDDPDAWAYYVVCVCCAAQGPWRKCEAGAVREWNERIIEKQIVGLLEDIAKAFYAYADVHESTVAKIFNNRLDKYPIISGRMGDDLRIKEEG